MDGLLTALGIKKAALLGGFFGALISLKFFPELKNWWQRATTLLSGWACAAYVTPLISQWLELSDKHEGGVAFLLGVLGMAAISNIVKALPEWAQALKGRIGGDQ